MTSEALADSFASTGIYRPTDFLFRAALAGILGETNTRVVLWRGNRAK